MQPQQQRQHGHRPTHHPVTHTHSSLFHLFLLSLLVFLLVYDVFFVVFERHAVFGWRLPCLAVCHARFVLCLRVRMCLCLCLSVHVCSCLCGVSDGFRRHLQINEHKIQNDQKMKKRNEQPRAKKTVFTDVFRAKFVHSVFHSVFHFQWFHFFHFSFCFLISVYPSWF